MSIQETTIAQILSFLGTIRPEFEKDGIVICGVFGSCARGDAGENSDIDVLVETTDRFVESRSGLECFLMLEDLRRRISERFRRKVDMADKAGLGDAGKIILEETMYVG